MLPPQIAIHATFPSAIRKVAFLGDYLPRKCGIATFMTDLRCAVAAEFPALQCLVARVNDLAADIGCTRQ
jgi:hypothetical protein